MKPIRPIYIKLLVVAVILWIISITFCVTDLCNKVGNIEHNLVHAATVGHGHHETLEVEETSIADSLPAPAPEPSEAEEIMDEEIVDQDA